MNYYESQTYYDILGLPKNGKNENGEIVSLESIINARNRMKFGSPDDRVPFRLWSKIDEAYDVLSDPDRRKEYDQYLEREEFNKNIIVDSEREIEPETPVVESETPEIEPVTPVVEPEISEIEPETPVVEPEIPEIEPETPVVESETPEIEPETPVVEQETPEVEPKKFNPVEISRYTETKPLSGPYYTDEEFQEFNHKTNLFTSSVVGFAVGSVVFNPVVGGVCAIVAPYIVSRISKMKLKKQSKELTPEKFQTGDSKLIEEYNKKLEDEIYKLLEEPHNNYRLEIERLRYENQIELLRKRIELKKSEEPKNGLLIKYKLELSALLNQLETSERILENIKAKIQKYKKEHSLSKTNEQISKNIEEIDKKEKENKETSGPLDRRNKSKIIKKLELKNKILIEKRNGQAKRIKLTQQFVGKAINGIVTAYDVTRNVANLFISNEEIDERVNSVVSEGRSR